MTLTMLGNSYKTYRNKPSALGCDVTNANAYAYAPVSYEPLGADIPDDLMSQFELEESLQNIASDAGESSKGDIFNVFGKILKVVDKVVDISGDVKTTFFDEETGQEVAIKTDASGNITNMDQLMQIFRAGQTTNAQAFDMNTAIPWIVGGAVAIALVAGIATTKRR